MAMSVRKKLYMSFGAILAIMLVMVTVITKEVFSSHAVAEEVRTDDVPETIQYLILNHEVGEMYRNALNSLIEVEGAQSR